MSGETETRQDEPDDSEPSPERQAELRAAYEVNVKVGKPAYAGVVIHTRGEVTWIMRERTWLNENAVTPEQAIDFRRTGFVDAVLDGTNFTGVNFSGAYISGKFRGALFYFANLSGALASGDFRDANFSWADLRGAAIGGDFRGANLIQARLDAATLFGMSGGVDESGTIHLDEKTRVLDTVWNGAILANAPWEQVPRLGDEVDIKDADSRKERVQALRDAARAYRGLAKALQAQGLTTPALRYRRREQQLERRALLYSFAIGPWIFFCLLNLVSGYGDRPGRALACYVAVVGAFTGAYWAITNQVFGFIQSHSAHLAWYEALVLSISSFHGRGFLPSMLSLGDPIALVAAAEAIIGLFIELVFIATFTQRFFAR